MSTDATGRDSVFGFSREDIRACVRRRGLLSLEIEFSLACNFRCPYCYADAEAPPEALSVVAFEGVLRQARELGARRIVILGGEPMLYPHLRAMIDFIVGLGMEVEMFTNGTGMTREAAEFMARRRVAVVVKKNTMDPGLQNQLTGCDCGYEIIHDALANLRLAGYPGDDGRSLAVSTIVCPENLAELPALWRWSRRQGIEPYVEMITPQGGARDNARFAVPPARIRTLFEELCAIDREEFGHRWTPQPPLVGHACLRHQYSCLVGASGIVFPCVGVTIPIGDVRHESLRDILARSEILDDLRRHRQTIKEPCANCEQAESCYGCRGAAFQLTGDHLAPDPLCWRNADAAIEALPMPVDRLIPHGPGIRLVRRLMRIAEFGVELEVVVPPAGPFLDEDGRLDACAYPEMLAQGIAASHGFRLSPEARRRHRGYLLGIRNLAISGEAHADEILTLTLRKEVQIDSFGVVSGIVSRQGQELARGEIKVWQGEADAPPAADVPA